MSFNDELRIALVTAVLGHGRATPGRTLAPLTYEWFLTRAKEDEDLGDVLREEGMEAFDRAVKEKALEMWNAYQKEQNRQGPRVTRQRRMGRGRTCRGKHGKRARRQTASS